MCTGQNFYLMGAMLTINSLSFYNKHIYNFHITKCHKLLLD